MFDPRQQQSGRRERVARSRANMKSGERAHTFGQGSRARYMCAVSVIIIMVTVLPCILKEETIVAREQALM